MGPTGEAVLKACVWEATARKLGNVHRYTDFAGLTYPDFVLSAGVIAPVLDGAASRPVGDTVLSAIHATRRVTSTNTNLGIVLLLAPLAAVPQEETDLRAGVERILASLTVDDARQVYRAIRLAIPGGLGKVESQDVADEPTGTLREVMAMATDRDMIAAQYANGFADVFDFGVPALRAIKGNQSLEHRIQKCQLDWLCEHRDSLIARKFGTDAADSVREVARQVRGGCQKWDAMDAWLRRMRYNPGTTADLVTACLFVGFRDGWLATISGPPAENA